MHLFLFFLVLTLILAAGKGFTQEKAPAAESVKSPPSKLASTFSGTLAEDDPDNQKASEEEAKLFGREEGKDAEEPNLEGATHLLQFDFKSQVRFVDLAKLKPGETSEEPYLEVEYDTRFKMPVMLVNRRKIFKEDIREDVKNWGSLAKNEFFDCKLQIDDPQMSVEVTTKINEEKNEDGDIANRSLALRVSLPQKISEDWFSLCSDNGGASLNTKGDVEEYNQKVLDLIDPPLSGILVDHFDPDLKTVIHLEVSPKKYTDAEISSDVIFSGEGEIRIDPL